MSDQFTKKERLEFFLETGDYGWLYENNAPPKINRVPVVAPEKIGRNAECPCGSGKKYKKCCEKFNI